MCYMSHRQQDYFAGRLSISTFVSCGFSERLLTSVELLCKSLHWKWQKKVFWKVLRPFIRSFHGCNVNKPFVGDHGKAKRFCCQSRKILCWFGLNGQVPADCLPGLAHERSYTRGGGVSRFTVVAGSVGLWCFILTPAPFVLLSRISERRPPLFVKHMLVFILYVLWKRAEEREVEVKAVRETACTYKKIWWYHYDFWTCTVPCIYVDLFWAFFILLAICSDIKILS